MEMENLAEQSTLSLSLARAELPRFGIKQLVEEDRAVTGTIFGWRIRIKPASQLGFFAGCNLLANDFGVFKYPGLDGFMF